jgi:hypothetical protein
MSSEGGQTLLSLAFHHIDLPGLRALWIVTKASTDRHVTPVKVAPLANMARTGAFPNFSRR